MALRNKYLFVGVDLHKEKHVAVIVNHWGDKIASIQFENKPSAFPEMLEEIFKHKKKPLRLVFGLEDVGGYGRRFALFLVEKKQIVKEVNASLGYAQRLSHPSTHKDDWWDAYCTAQILMQRMNELPDANPQDIYFNIGQLVGRRRTLTNSGTRLKIQLNQQLAYHYPSYKKFFSEIDGKTALNFFEEYPSPYKLKNINPETLTEQLKEWSHYYLGLNKAKEILDLIEKDGDTTRGQQEYRDFLIQSIIKDIRFREEEIQKVDKLLETLINQLDYKLTTMQGVDIATASGIIAEIGDINRFKNADKLARFAGVSPTTFSSGNSQKVCISKQGNRVLNGILYMLAMRQIIVSKNTKEPYNPIFYEYYQKKIKEGKSKASAIVCVQRRLVNIIYSMMKNKTEYIKPIGKKQDEIKTVV
jgi:transposase